MPPRLVQLGLAGLTAMAATAAVAQAPPLPMPYDPPVVAPPPQIRSAPAIAAQIPPVSRPPMALGAPGGTTDHSRLPALQRSFASGPEVTAACLSCHTEASHQVMRSIHWTWTMDLPQTGQRLGKAHEVNAFCGNVAVNETRCTSCHAGYGWTDVRQPNRMGPEKVDCLACHDRSGQYAKLDNKAGLPALAPLKAGAKTITGADAKPVDLTRAAQSVGDPGRDNCGNCHFYGGGGDNVKHGDLSSALIDPPPSVDVHMSRKGANMTCAACHVSDSHVLAGSRYDTDVVPDDHPAPGAAHGEAACASCHGETPHARTTVIGLKLNDHTDTVACQSCHIPAFARGGVATKTEWDWSTAGRLKDGKPYSEEGFTQSNGKHLHSYLSTKGSFEWAENVVPTYAWFNGTVRYTLPDETIDPSGVVPVNTIEGAPGDPKARIFPFKVMHGSQAYDSGLNRLVYNHVYGPETKTALWTNFDWDKSIRAAMDYVNLPYSGQHGFVRTTMHWPVTHMVAPADEALRCTDCHAPQARLAGIAGVYMPAATAEPARLAGLALLVMTLAGVLVHGAIRLTRRNGKGGHHG